MGVCSFVSLFADSRLSLFPWLVGWLFGCMVCVYFVCFSALAAHFRGLLALFEGFLCFSCTLGGPGTPLQHLGLHFATLAGQFCSVFVIGSTLGFNLLILGLRLGAPWVHFDVFL